MKIVALTMRSDLLTSRNERRDAIDHRWYHFLHEINAFPLLLPNCCQQAERILSSLPVGMIILTGGGDISAITGEETERDRVENACLRYALRRDIPVLGICRGMQQMVSFCGGELVMLADHVARRHPVIGARQREVNSWHQYGVHHLPVPLEVYARSEDGSLKDCAVRKESG